MCICLPVVCLPVHTGVSGFTAVAPAIAVIVAVCVALIVSVLFFVISTCAPACLCRCGCVSSCFCMSPLFGHGHGFVQGVFDDLLAPVGGKDAIVEIQWTHIHACSVNLGCEAQHQLHLNICQAEEGHVPVVPGLTQMPTGTIK